ncbi:MAG: carboxynorspermidine decarboxylase [Desulfovibrio sp.]|nr:carboxynorspermidine decarboxylase [Desulfovibrio sp.]
MALNAPPTALADPGIPSRCFVIDEGKLIENAAILDDIQKRSGAKILMALKAFAAWDSFPLLSRAFAGPLYGTCASSVDEARLGKEKFGGEVHAFAAAWEEGETRELLSLADHIVFNSAEQWRRFRPLIDQANSTFRADNPVKAGLRINPEHSEGATAIYNPCSPGSRLGIRPGQFEKISDFSGISGLHFHTLCEQNAGPLARTLEAVGKKFPIRRGFYQWFNFGGGHHITRADYDRVLLVNLINDWRRKYGGTIYLEPGEAVALDAGWLTATVLDIVEADLPVAILDVSAACHMPDVLEMPYIPDVWLAKDGNFEKASGEDGHRYRLAGKSCLAGDVVGEYGFKKNLKPGDRFVFGDMAIYSMVKTNTFNGLRLPSIGALAPDGEKFRMIKEFGYEDFRDRLS